MHFQQKQNFSRTIVRSHLLLSSLSELKSPRERTLFIKKLSRHDITALRTVIFNILNGNIPISKVTEAKLLSYQHLLRKLMRKRINGKKFKALFPQSGGILPAIFAPIVAGILSALPAIKTGLAISSGIAGTAAGIANTVKAARAAQQKSD